jgi:hypothetical protein
VADSIKFTFCAEQAVSPLDGVAGRLAADPTGIDQHKIVR